MGNKENYIKFPIAVRKQVREEQNYACAYCGISGCTIEIHHMVPIAQGRELGWSEGQIISRENAVGLCGEEGNDCHEKFDVLARDRIYFDDMMNFEGRSYPPSPIAGAESAPPRILQFPERPREPARFYQAGDD